MRIKGNVHTYGDNVDTDVIIPARYLNTSDPDELKQYCMIDIDADFAGKVQPGDIMAGGSNFGCGSSREHAPIAIKASGISCVIAQSFARIFYRNAINIGLPIIESPEAAHAIIDGDVVEVDFDHGEIKIYGINNQTQVFKVPPYPQFIQDIVSAGGLMEKITAQGIEIQDSQTQGIDINDTHAHENEARETGRCS